MRFAVANQEIARYIGDADAGEMGLSDSTRWGCTVRQRNAAKSRPASLNDREAFWAHVISDTRPRVRAYTAKAGFNADESEQIYWDAIAELIMDEPEGQIHFNRDRQALQITGSCGGIVASYPLSEQSAKALERVAAKPSYE